MNFFLSIRVSILSLGLSTPALADTTFNQASAYAWSANSGWISFRHDQPRGFDGVAVHSSYLQGYAYSANFGWISFGNTPSNGHTYSNQGSDHGVNHDGQGNLSGYAYAANAGWINFGWTNTNDTNRPRFDLASGSFAGFAYSANLGWLTLDTSLLSTQFIARLDTDNDGIDDAWEFLHFNSLNTASSNSDTDFDGISDLLEYQSDTNPNNASHFLKIVSQTHSLSHTQVSIAFTSQPSRFYMLEYSNDLGKSDPWTSSNLGVFRASSGATTTKTFLYPTNEKKFFRARAVLPLLAP